MGSNKFFKTLSFCLIFFGIAVLGHSQVDREELERGLAPVTFINHEGPVARIDTREQIRQIGASLGQLTRAGQIQAGALNRYFVIHVVAPPEGDKLSAVIFGVGSDAAVDHIRNLRTIIQGYLQEAFDYSESDASLLAEFITIYNAVYRGDWDFFVSRYKTPVIAHLTPERAGLSVRFDEWPGRTLMVIPLGIGGLSAVDTAAISDDRVLEELRQADDRRIDLRRDMVDLMEREAEAAEERAEELRAEIAREEQAIAEQQAEVQAEQQQIAQEREQLAEAVAAGVVTPQQAAIQEQELDRREAEAEQQAEELDRREEELALQREDAVELEQFAEQRFEDAQQGREAIAQDLQELLQQDEPLQGLFVVEIGNDNVRGRLVSLDPASGMILRRSNLTTVFARTLTVTDDLLLSVAGATGGNAAIRLIEINRRTLEMVRQGDDDIYPNSLIWMNGNEFYAITVNSDGALNLGRFDMDLQLQARSEVQLHSGASVCIQQGSLLTQRSDGRAVLLDPADLREIGQ